MVLWRCQHSQDFNISHLPFFPGTRGGEESEVMRWSAFGDCRDEPGLIWWSIFRTWDCPCGFVGHRTIVPNADINRKFQNPVQHHVLTHVLGPLAIAAQQWCMFCRAPWHRRLNYHDHSRLQWDAVVGKMCDYIGSSLVGSKKKKNIYPLVSPSAGDDSSPLVDHLVKSVGRGDRGCLIRSENKMLQKNYILHIICYHNQIWSIKFDARRWVSNLCDLRWMQPTRILAFRGTAYAWKPLYVYRILSDHIVKSSSLSGNGATWVFFEGAC